MLHYPEESINHHLPESRIASIDIIRGLVMVIMALDHVRDLMHVKALTQSPTDITTTTPLLFFTRIVTHLCAPAFVFLAGSSAYLSIANKGKASGLYLIKRGLALILIDLILVNFLLYFDFHFHTLLFGVVATIGFGMIVLGMGIKRTPTIAAMLGLVIIAGHGLFSMASPSLPDVAVKMLSPFFTLVVYPISNGINLIIAYPPIPWLGILLTGYGCGRIFLREEGKQRQLLMAMGILAIVIFFLIRIWNAYGDPQPWMTYEENIKTLFSFLNVTKYPPSLSFTLVTLGILFLLLGNAMHLGNQTKRVLSVYGRVPLFFYLVHFFLIHLLTIAMLFIQGYHWTDIDFSKGSFGRPINSESGIPLWLVLVLWPIVVAALYKPCQWYGQYKKTNHNFLTRYL